MADETEKAPASGGFQASGAPTAGSLATEKAVPSAAVTNTSQYVVTVDDKTGVWTRIEKLDEQSGNRTELSQEEYTAAASYGGIPVPGAQAGFGDLSTLNLASPEVQAALVQAYYQGVADYVKAITTQK